MTPTVQDIAEALRLMGMPSHRLGDVREHAHAGMKWAQYVIAHACTIAKLRIATESAETLRKEAALLLQNSEGCAQNHYGHDCNLYGMPQWLADSRERITGAASTLAQIKDTTHAQ